jgi:hypothetical protein
MNKNLKEKLAQKQFYEAHQIYHSLSQRLIKQKKVRNAIGLLQEGGLP